MVMGGLSTVAFIGLSVGTETEPPVRIVISIAIGVGAVFFWISSKTNKRMSMIEEQLPDTVDLMVRSLKVEHPFASPVQIVAKEVQDPLGTAFGVITDEAAYGRDVGEAFKDMAERLDMQDMRFLAVAVTIQQQAGGNLTEILAASHKLFVPASVYFVA